MGKGSRDSAVSTATGYELDGSEFQSLGGQDVSPPHVVQWVTGALVNRSLRTDYRFSDAQKVCCLLVSINLSMQLCTCISANRFIFLVARHNLQLLSGMNSHKWLVVCIIIEDNWSVLSRRKRFFSTHNTVIIALR
jgi:hypothetical protein